MIQPITFIDTAAFTSMYVAKHKKHLENGRLFLRDVPEDEEAAVDLPIIAEWLTAKSLLTKIRLGAAPYLGGQAATLGKAWLEALPPETATPWAIEEGDYADQHFRTRTCILPSAAAWSYSGGSAAPLAVGILNAIGHQVLHCEANFGAHTRVHLIVDVRRPDPAPRND